MLLLLLILDNQNTYANYDILKRNPELELFGGCICEDIKMNLE